MKLIKVYLRLIYKYLQYYFRAKTIYDLHSPFLVAFTKAVLEDDRHFYAFSYAEDIRERLKSDRTKVSIVELGAGSLVSDQPERSIQNIVTHTAVPPYAGRQLFRITKHFEPKNMLELGTSLGISTIYQAFGSLNGQMITIEGNPHLQPWSEQAFTLCGLKNINQQTGPFEAQLPLALKKLKQLDYVLMDGDHRKENSWNYFETCLKYAHNDSVFVIADIHWSDEMEACWKWLKDHRKVSLSVDLFHFGVLFFRKELRYENHVSLVKAKYKPWRLGFF